MIAVVGPKDKGKYKDWIWINTTSSSKNWSRGLSPFFLGPVTFPEGLRSENFENMWQYSKVFKDHLNDQLEILPSYYEWRKTGFSLKKAQRYPKGKGAVPEFSLWNGERLGYIEARKKIYCPEYSKLVRKTKEYQFLLSIYKKEGKIVLFDFDGYDYLSEGKTLEDVLNDPTKKMGHGFVLAMILQRDSISSN